MYQDVTKIPRDQCTTALAIDGGGVRGIIPSRLLQEIEERTHLATASLFDHVAGSSTGSIVASALLCPQDKRAQPKFDAKTIVSLFQNRSKDVFPPSWWGYLPFVNRLRNAEYSREGLSSTLTDYVGKTPLCSLLKPLYIPTYEITQGAVWVFDSKARDESTKSLKIVDALSAATAAPTYFNPYPLPIIGTFIDGGIYMNNPADMLYHKVGETGRSSREIFMLSLGTGTCITKLPYDTNRGWGIETWGRYIVPLMMQASSENVEAKLAELYKDSSLYHRLQIEVDQNHSALDDSRAENLSYLLSLAEHLIEEKSDEINDICETLLHLNDSKEETHQGAL